MKKTVAAILFFVVSSYCHTIYAQQQFTGWLASFNTFKTGKKTSIHTDVQWRSSDELKHTQTLLIRPGLNVHLSKKLTVTAGYAFIQNRRVSGNVSGYAPEHRIWQQLLYNHKLNNNLLSHRLRLEQRFIPVTVVQDNEIKKDGSVYANRLRYFIRDVIPFHKQEKFSKGLFAALQNEVFVNIGNTKNVNGKFFDQNRLYLAMGYRVKSSFDIEAGYMYQYISGKNKATTNNNIVQLAGYLRL